MIKTIKCRNCQRTVQVTPRDDDEGHPYGWYSVTVSVPPEMGHDGKTYRWVGRFCSVGCLVAHERVMIGYVELLAGSYPLE